MPKPVVAVCCAGVVGVLPNIFPLLVGALGLTVGVAEGVPSPKPVVAAVVFSAGLAPNKFFFSGSVANRLFFAVDFSAVAFFTLLTLPNIPPLPVGAIKADLVSVFSFPNDNLLPLPPKLKLSLL